MKGVGIPWVAGFLETALTLYSKFSRAKRNFFETLLGLDFLEIERVIISIHGMMRMEEKFNVTEPLNSLCSVILFNCSDSILKLFSRKNKL